ncbi:transposable element tc3 transposase-like protein [Holotrichia oblita]|uniref:Transposable element tc3 transposase-like protein n=1 Tax=Holotrichia oblita TaxID=644536 RepID=A0ACB9SRT9_HOLOL|nr:transposable element tc3 transposase-like protein [Holotrichia oblita]
MFYGTGQKLENGEWVYSINRCIEEFRQFPNLPVTYAQLLKHIQACVIKFGEIGAVTRKPGGGAPKKRTANLIEDVQQRMEQSPKKSVATLSQQVGLSVGTCHTILKKHLKLFPYKIQAVSELKAIDFGTRTQYCQWFLNNVNNNDVLDKCWAYIF